MAGTDLECGQTLEGTVSFFSWQPRGLMEMRRRQQTRLHRVQRTSGEPVRLTPGYGARRGGKEKGEQSTGTVAVELSAGAPSNTQPHAVQTGPRGTRVGLLSASEKVTYCTVSRLLSTRFVERFLGQSHKTKQCFLP